MIRGDMKIIRPPHELTEEEKAKARAMRAALNEERAKRKAELLTKYEGNVCVLCGHRFITGVKCPKLEGNVCMSHCKFCLFLDKTFWHCLYRKIRVF